MIQPLPKDLHAKLVAAGITSFQISLSGGSDSGYHEVTLNPWNEEMHQLVSDWEENAFEYSGAGDGNDYGDEIVYDLVNNTVSHQEWSMERKEGPESSEKLQLR